MGSGNNFFFGFIHCALSEIFLYGFFRVMSDFTPFIIFPRKYGKRTWLLVGLYNTLLYTFWNILDCSLYLVIYSAVNIYINSFIWLLFRVLLEKRTHTGERPLFFLKYLLERVVIHSYQTVGASVHIRVEFNLFFNIFCL